MVTNRYRVHGEILRPESARSSASAFITSLGLYLNLFHSTWLTESLQVDPELVSEGQAWPVELFQTVLLTLIFTLYRTDKSALSRTVHLRSTFITLLRELGAFDAQILADHLKTHFSGTYAPYVISMRERLLRLLGLTYQFDAFFTLAYEKPLMLHCEEVGVGLPSTFALWNSYGLDIFAARHLEEPPGRFGFHISTMTHGPDSCVSPEFLVEDVQLGLCSLLEAIHVLTHSLPSKLKVHPSNTSSRALLIEILNDWKRELDKIDILANAKNTTGNTARYLLLAYRGEDNSAAASLERVNTLLQDGMVLYYYLRIYNFARLRPPGVVGPTAQSENVDLDIWQTSRQGREVLVCVFQILKIAESVEATQASSSPLLRHALAMCINMTKLLLPGQKCECLDGESQPAADANLQQWLKVGGSLGIDNTLVCACKLSFWVGRFDKALQKINVERSENAQSA